MEEIYKAQLDYVLDLPLSEFFDKLLSHDLEYSVIHDDNDGDPEQCLSMTISSDLRFILNGPVDKALRFRTHHGGGSSLQVHNALLVLIYAASFEDTLMLKGMDIDRTIHGIDHILEKINDMLEGVIILPEKVLLSNGWGHHYSFEIFEHLKILISCDGDIHVIVEMNITSIDEFIRKTETTWNPKPLCFPFKDLSHRMINALILLTIAIKNSRD